MKKKSQIFTWDMIMAVFFFMFTLSAIMYIWNSTSTRIESSETRHDMGWLAMAVGEQLVRTEGYPRNWNPETVEVLGLAESKDSVGFDSAQARLIDPDKFLNFVSMTGDDYPATRAMLFGASRYDFYINVSCKGGGVDCFNGLYVDDVIGTVACNSGLSFAISGNAASTSGPDDFCIIGDYISLDDVTYMVPSVKNAIFSEKPDIGGSFVGGRQVLERAIELNMVVYVPP